MGKEKEKMKSVVMGKRTSEILQESQREIEFHQEKIDQILISYFEAKGIENSSIEQIQQRQDGRYEVKLSIGEEE